MKISRPGIFIAQILLLILSIACNLTSTKSVGLDTAVAQTVGVELTKAAGKGTIETPALTPTTTLTTTTTPTPTSTITATPIVTNTMTATRTNTPIPCNQAIFISDVTFPDDSEVVINTNITKTWRLQNSGSCNWNSSYKIIFVSGDQMGAPAETQLTTGTVAPGSSIDVSVNMKVPGSTGDYRGNYRIKSGDGTTFGVGTGNVPFYIQIKAIQPALPPPPEPLFPDLYISEFEINDGNPIDDDVPIHVRVGVYNKGTAAAGEYIVRFWGLESFANHSCEWTVPSTNAKGGRILECNMQYASTYVDGLKAKVQVDVNDDVNESNEGNNIYTQGLNFFP